jgi:hypothetical protein
LRGKQRAEGLWFLRANCKTRLGQL